MRNMESLEYQQLSLFENPGDDPMKAITVSPVSSPSQVSSPLVALRSDSKQAVRLFGLESWMKKLVPAGEYVLLDGQHPQVLKPTLRCCKVLGEHSQRWICGVTRNNKQS